MFYKNSLVLSKNGLVFVKDLNVGDEIYCDNGYVVIKSIEKHFDRLVELKNDYLVTSKFTEDQQFLTREDKKIINKSLLDLNVDDIVSMYIGNGFDCSEILLIDFPYGKEFNEHQSNAYNHSTIFPKTITNDMSYFMGYCYGDGYVDKNKDGNVAGVSLSCSNDYDEIKTKLKNIITNTFNARPCVKKGDGDLEIVAMHSRKNMENFLKNDILKQKAGNLIFPEKILKSSTHIQGSFISGLFDADGCFQKTKKSYRITIIDKEFLEIIQKIFLSNGIVSRLSVEDRSKKGWNDLWRLSIIGKESIVRFRKMCKDSYKANCSETLNKIDHVTTIYTSKDLNLKYYKYSFLNDVDLISYKSINELKYVYKDVDENLPMVIKSYIKSKNECGFDECFSIDVDCKGIWVDGYYALI